MMEGVQKSSGARRVLVILQGWLFDRQSATEGLFLQLRNGLLGLVWGEPEDGTTNCPHQFSEGDVSSQSTRGLMI